MRLILISFFVIFFQFACAQATTLEIIASENNELTTILNNIEVVSQHTRLPILLRIFKVREHGECGTSLDSCPKETMYIAVSSFDEYPDQRLYILPKAFGWDFKRWVSLPSKDSTEDYAIVELAEKCINESSNKVGWVEKTYQLYVNTSKAKLEGK